ncbi:MerR family DNA-binding transcriptional regulator [Nocardioides sambongensis]|uniref:MerR family DNA-binding transcriptional regulator n=1 Tax=Nocardioides sambongensis TaxID=2589074 RepID=UPI0018C88BAB|nr:MerR family DNA-binding transcriptional regulator [Nocardioides sambongensis]
MPPVPTGVTIAEAADRLGLTVDTLRYYERDGLLLRAVPRSASGHRRYHPRTCGGSS